MVMRLEFPVVLSEARDVQNTIGINTKGNFNLRGTEGMLDSSNLLSNLSPGVSTISLVYLNKHIGLVVKLRGEDFEFLLEQRFYA
jgi:hypothetical protein